MTTTLVILAAIAALLFWAVAIYNQLIALRNAFRNAFAQIEVQLKRRHDLIPNLVESVKGYIQHERGTLEAVIAARNAAADSLRAAAGHAGDPGATSALAGAESALGGAMLRFNALMEAYPDLKANANVAQLSAELASTENQIASTRAQYNNQATKYNTYRESFPAVLLAGAFGHTTDAGLLEFAEGEALQTPPSVNFN